MKLSVASLLLLMNLFYLSSVNAQPANSATVSSQNTTCQGTDGQIQLMLSGDSTWFYQVFDYQYNSVAVERNFNGIVVLDQLTQGDYYLKLSYEGYVYPEQRVTVEGPQLVEAGMTIPDQMSTWETMITDNTSEGATSYTWDMGDGTILTEEAPAYSYTAPGVYTVTLTASNGTCEDVKTKKVTVFGVVASIDEDDANTARLLVNQKSGKLYVNFLGSNNNQIETIQIHNLLGQQLASLTPEQHEGTFKIDASQWYPGYHIVSAKMDDGSVISQKFLVSE